MMWLTDYFVCYDYKTCIKIAYITGKSYNKRSVNMICIT